MYFNMGVKYFMGIESTGVDNRKDISKFSPSEVALAVEIGIVHGLNNSLTALTGGLQLMSNQEATELRKLVISMGRPNESENDEFKGMIADTTEGNNDSLTRLARDVCRFYLDAFARNLRTKGSKEKTKKIVDRMIKGYVPSISTYRGTKDTVFADFEEPK